MRVFFALFGGEKARKLAGAIRRFGARKDGAILVEAALVLPILILLFLALVEFSEAFTARRRVGAVAATTADLVAQAQSVTTSDLDDIVSVANSIMAPYAVAPLSITITSVGFNSQNQIVELWSCSWSTVSAAPSCSATGAAFTLPAGLLSSGQNSVSAQSLIVAQTSYTFTPPIGQYLLGGVTFNQTAYFTPRITPYVTKQ
jgi:Flp pilus assembly protein TadG